MEAVMSAKIVDKAGSDVSGTHGKKPLDDRQENIQSKNHRGCGVAETDMHSSDSDTEEERVIMRKVSTHKQIKSKVSIKEGYLMLQMPSSFQRMRRHYFKLRPRRMYYAKTKDADIFDEVPLVDCSIAERSTKNVNCSFSIITPFHSLILCAESRREMDEWISAIKAVQSGEFYEPQQFYMENLSGGHNWYTCTHARPTYCNVCRDVLSGVMNHGLSCEVCKFKAHKRCAAKAVYNCKWATLSTVGKNIIEDEDGVWIPHQWMEGNLPVSAKCVVCDKTCGSVLRLQDWRCLWCKAVVHSSCKSQLPATCPLGICKMSIVPPTALNSIDCDGYWQALPSGQCSSPLLVFVNTKSGDNQGVKFLRRFRQFLNPAQVFDLMCTGPHAGLRMFQKFDTFRILVCGGDGSIGWVLTEMDKMNLHKKAQVGVLPLGTGNDLAQVMGWGNVCDDDTQVPAILERYERASAKLLDRWSIMTYEGPIHRMPSSSNLADEVQNVGVKLNLQDYELSVAKHLSIILNSDQNSEVTKSATVLCDTIKDLVAHVECSDNAMAVKCNLLEERLNSLMTTLDSELKAADEGHFPKTNADGKSDKDISMKDSMSKDSFAEDPSTPERPLTSSSMPTSSENKRQQSVETGIGNIRRQILEHDRLKYGMEEHKATAEVGVPPVYSGHSRDSSKNLNRKSEPHEAEGTAHFRSSRQFMSQADNLKDAVRQIIEHSERDADERNLPDPQEENEGMLTMTVPTVSESSGETSPLPLVNHDIRRKFCVYLGPTAGHQLSPSASAPDVFYPSNSSSGTFNSAPAHLANLSPKNKVKGLQASSSSKSERRVTRGFMGEDGGCNHVNPDFTSRGSFVSRVLLANADALCAAATPLINFGEPILNELFMEKCVMNNYFGIGLDAKIALDFHRKREEHPKKCSRTKNMVWYGMLATKEFALKTYKNLEQRIRLECDGQYIPLPRLQGIVVLNIPSFMGGANFWGGKTGNQTFMAPSYNDKVLEVVAVFGTMQLGMAMVVPEGVLQHHRIAQCRTVKITILGEEGVPLQVDGEAWLQPPGIVKIEHKNWAQMLCRDRQFEETLKSWEYKQQRFIDRNLSAEYLSENELELVGEFAEAVCAITEDITVSMKTVNMLSEELLPLIVAVQRISNKLRPYGRLGEATTRSHVSNFLSNVDDLTTMLTSILNTKYEVIGDLAEKFVEWLHWLERERKKVGELKWMSNMICPATLEEPFNPTPYQKRQSRFRLVPFLKKSQKKDQKMVNLDINVNNWTVEEVHQWLETLQFGEYKEIFTRHDIRGDELLRLESSDLKGMGITKVGHVKRIQAGIKDLQKAMNQFSK